MWKQKKKLLKIKFTIGRHLFLHTHAQFLRCLLDVCWMCSLLLLYNITPSLKEDFQHYFYWDLPINPITFFKYNLGVIKKAMKSSSPKKITTVRLCLNGSSVFCLRHVYDLHTRTFVYEAVCLNRFYKLLTLFITIKWLSYTILYNTFVCGLLCNTKWKNALFCQH